MTMNRPDEQTADLWETYLQTALDKLCSTGQYIAGQRLLKHKGWHETSHWDQVFMIEVRDTVTGQLAPFGLLCEGDMSDNHIMCKFTLMNGSQVLAGVVTSRNLELLNKSIKEAVAMVRPVLIIDNTTGDHT